MPDQRLDRRIVRTRQRLRDALFALIEEKGYTAISVQDLTDRADINRVTFYFHYRDKDDLLLTVMQELYEALEATQPPPDDLAGWARQDALHAFNHLREYAHIYRVLMGEKTMFSLLGRLIDYSAQAALRAERARLPAGVIPPVPLEMTEHFYAGAFVGLARWWLLNGMPYPPEHMAEVYLRLEANTGAWAVGLDPTDHTAS